MFFLIGIPLISIFIILWFVFGGLRSPFGLVLTIFSAGALLLAAGIWIYALSNLNNRPVNTSTSNSYLGTSIANNSTPITTDQLPVDPLKSRPKNYQISLMQYGGSTMGQIKKSAWIPLPNYKQLNSDYYINTSSNSAGDILDVYCAPLYSASNPTSSSQSYIIPADLGADGTGGYRMFVKDILVNNIEFTCTDLN